MSKVKVWGYGGGKNGLKQEEAVVKGGKHTIRKLCAKRGGIEKVLLWWCGGRGGLNLCNRNNFFRKIASSEPNDEERSGGQQQKKRLLIENLSLQQQLYQIEQVVAWCT